MERLEVVDEVTTEWIVGFPHMLKRPSGRLDELLQPHHLVHRHDLATRQLANLMCLAAG
jgi:hypothetical protein